MKNKSIRTLLTLAGGLLVVLLAMSCEPSKKQEDSVEVAKEQNDSAIADRDDEKDADFVVNAVASNYAEIKLAQLANNKSIDPGVKELANKLETDHTKILKELKAYANVKGISVPMEESPEDTKALTDLEGKGPKDFDKEWCEALEDRHEKTINKFEARENKTEDARLKEWIAATLPELRSHLEMLDKHKDATE